MQASRSCLDTPHSSLASCTDITVDPLSLECPSGTYPVNLLWIRLIKNIEAVKRRSSWFWFWFWFWLRWGLHLRQTPVCCRGQPLPTPRT